MEIEKNKRKLSIKFMAILLGMGILIYIGVLFVGQNLYDHSIKEYYDMMAYDSAEIAEGFFTAEQLAEYSRLVTDFNHGKATVEDLKKVMESPEYIRSLDLLYHLRVSEEANDVFVVSVDLDVLNSFTQETYEAKTWNPLYYIADCYEVPSDNFLLGDSGRILPEFLDAVRESYQQGKRYEDFYISDGGFGYNLTAMYPVVQEGKTIAFVGVEIPMKTLQDNLINFTIRISLVTGIVVLVSMFLAIGLFYKIVISPIKLSASEARQFVENNNQISEKLKSIRTGDEIQTLSESLLHMEIGINEYIDNVKRLTAEKERIGAELNVATQIQADMLPRIYPAFPQIKDFDIYATMDPAKEVGGDFYDYFLIDSDHLGLVMADVSGKGVPAALFMVIAKTLIKNRAQMGGEPSEILEFVNNQLCDGNEAQLFVTVWFAILEISTGKGIAVNAGHEHPVLKRADGTYELVVYRHSPAVAVMEGMKFRQHEFRLNPGDTLFVYTDGVPEATNAENELYGTDRMLDALNRTGTDDLKEILHGLREDIDVFMKDAPQFDDITMMGIRYFGPADQAQKSDQQTDR